MKIIAELIRVRQDWDPDTNTHLNSVIFAFAGVEVEVPASEEQVRAIIIESQHQRGAVPQESTHRPDPGRYEAELGVGVDDGFDPYAGGEGLDAALNDELTDEGEETVFGGDFEPDPDTPLRHAPTIFQGDTPQAAPALDAETSPAPAPPLTPTQQRKAALAALRQQDPAAQRAATKNAMRARAAQIPPRKMAKDDLGNPIVYEDHGRRIEGPVGRPEVVVRQQAPSVHTGGDDDGFAQG